MMDEAETMVLQYAKDVPLIEDGPDQWFTGNGGGLIPYGCKIRCTYYKKDGDQNPREFGIVTKFLKK